MNRRSFLKFAGLAPVVPMIAVEALKPLPIIDFDELIVNFCMYRLDRHEYWDMKDNIGKAGTVTMMVKQNGLYGFYHFETTIQKPDMKIVNEINNKELRLHYYLFTNDEKVSPIGSIFEFKSLVSFKSNYFYELEIANLQIEFNTEFPFMKAGEAWAP